MHQPAKGFTVDNAVAIPLERGTDRVLLFRPFSAFGALGQYRSGRKILRLLLLGLLPNRHRAPPFWTSF